MYTQIFLVTSVRGKVFAPQIAASSALSVFGAKMPEVDLDDNLLHVGSEVA